MFTVERETPHGYEVVRRYRSEEQANAEAYRLFADGSGPNTRVVLQGQVITSFAR